MSRAPGQPTGPGVVTEPGADDGPAGAGAMVVIRRVISKAPSTSPAPSMHCGGGPTAGTARPLARPLARRRSSGWGAAAACIRRDSLYYCDVIELSVQGCWDCPLPVDRWLTGMGIGLLLGIEVYSSPE